MNRGRTIVDKWLDNQDAGKYKSFDESMEDLANMINDKPAAVNISYEPIQPRTYREEQAAWRAAGFDAYNCDMVDEFPTR